MQGKMQYMQLLPFDIKPSASYKCIFEWLRKRNGADKKWGILLGKSRQGFMTKNYIACQPIVNIYGPIDLSFCPYLFCNLS